MKKSYKYIIPALAGVFTLASCSNEEGGGFTYPTSESVIGYYKGIIETPASAASDSATWHETEAKVTPDSIHIADMAIEDILQILSGNNSDSAGYPEKIGYSMKYERKINNTFDTVWVETQPDTLQFDYTRNDSTHHIKVVFTEQKKGNYCLENRKLRLNIEATRLIINEDTVQTFTSIPYQVVLDKQ